MMEFTNFFTKESVRPRCVMEQFVLLLSPFAPHIGEELWRLLGKEKTLAYEPWPQFDESRLREDSVEVVVQVKGKVRGKVTVPTDATKAATEAAARADTRVAAHLEGKEIVKTIVLPGKLVNFVVK